MYDPNAVTTIDEPTPTILAPIITITYLSMSEIGMFVTIMKLVATKMKYPIPPRNIAIR